MSDRAFERYFHLKARKRSLAEDRRIAEDLKGVRQGHAA